MANNHQDEDIFKKLEQYEKARFIEHSNGSFGARVNIGGFGKWVVLSKVQSQPKRKYFTDVEVMQQGFSIVDGENSLNDES